MSAGIVFDVIAAIFTTAIALIAAALWALRRFLRPEPYIPAPPRWFGTHCTVRGCRAYLGEFPTLGDAAWEVEVHRLVSHDDAHRGTRP